MKMNLQISPFVLSSSNLALIQTNQ